MINFKKAAVVANLALIIGLISPLTPVAYASSNASGNAAGNATVNATASPGSAALVTPYTIPNGHLNITLEDLKFLLDQIKMGEAHAARTTAGGASGSASIRYGESTTLVFPYDVSSVNRCLTAQDISAAATTAFGPTGLSNNYIYANTAPWGIRQVDGQCNNITNVIAETPGAGNTGDPVLPQPTINTADTGIWGAADQLFARLSPKATGADGNVVQQVYANGSNNVTDPQPRIISTLISDQSTNNPAAIAAATETAGILYGTGPLSETAINAQTGVPSTVLQIPNVTPDFNASAGYNSWFTLFGQFFDHGLDLIPKGGAKVLIPLQADDSLYSVSPSSPNMMVLTRGTDATGEASNITTPYVDQSQTYGSHQSANFFLREYTFEAATGIPTFTGNLLTGTDGAYSGGVNPTTAPTSKFDASLDVITQGYKPALPTTWSAAAGGTLTTGNGGVSNKGLATWKEIKAQAYLLGILLTDWDVTNIPVIATNQYGKFIPAPALLTSGAANPAAGFPMMLFSDHAGGFMWLAGTPTAPIATTIHVGLNTWYAVSSGHPFINDTMSAAVPWGSVAGLLPDADPVMNGALSYNPSSSRYDNENLDAHFVAGDGRVNENIGLSAIHYTFLAEHNTLATDIRGVIGTSSSELFKSEWTPERVYQAARWINEMQYMHLAFDEFVRRMSVGLPAFAGYDPNVNTAINQEFASAVYRLGHSMLNETIARSNPDQPYDPANNQDVSLITGFINPAQARLQRPAVIASASAVISTNSITYTVKAGEISPANGSVVTVTGMANAALNVTSGVVTGHTPTTFTVATKYVSGASAVAANLTVAADVSGLPILDANSASVATAVVNDPGAAGYTYTPAESAASIAEGMTAQRGNEIDEFVTDSVRNNLLGLPLDLASLNLTRGRDTMLPTLNQFRKANAAGFPPYISWATFVNGLRYKASGINFIAAYGTHPTVKRTTLATVTLGSYDPGTGDITYTFTGTPTLTVGQTVSVSGFTAPDTGYNVTNAVVKSVPSGSTFTVHNFTTYGKQDVFVTGSNLTVSVPVISITASSSAPATAKLDRESTAAEKRAAATALVAAAATPGDAADFYNSTGAWASVETGFNLVDLWSGGLAENPQKQPVAPPLLGPVFDKVFQDQMLKLQNGDRFYYLGRIVGTNLGEEIPAETFIDILRRNTPSRTPGRTSATYAIGAPSFSFFDCSFGQAGNAVDGASLFPTQAGCAPMKQNQPSAGFLETDNSGNVIIAADPGSANGAKLAGHIGDDSMLGGVGNDILLGGNGGDLIAGGAGNDIIFGQGGDDVIRSNEGDDVINAAGISPAGTIVDAGVGNDFVHKGGFSGLAGSFLGQAGNDFIQGSSDSDLLLGGGEGADWIEGLSGPDGLIGDAGLNGGGGIIIDGGNDILMGQAGADLLAGDGGDDILVLGDSVDAADGGTGFNWVTYAYNQRFDNGGGLTSTYVDLSGFHPIATDIPLDALLGIDGIALSPGNDIAYTTQGSDLVLTGGSGTVGTTVVTFQGAHTTIVAGMQVSGTGIAPNATSAAAVITTDPVSGLSTTTIDLSIPNIGTVSGPVKFNTWPLRDTSVVTGIAALLNPGGGTKTAGWNKQNVVSGAYLTSVATPTGNVTGSFIQLTNSDPSIQVGSTISIGAFSAVITDYEGTLLTLGSIAGAAPAGGTLSVTITPVGQWSGGNIILGGDGNDTIYVTGGSNVIDGSSTINVGLKAVYAVGGAEYLVGADRKCGASITNNCFSSMSLIAAAVDAGIITPSGITTVHEMLPTTDAAAQTADTVVFPYAKNLYTIVAVTGGFDLTGPDGNVNRVVNIDLAGFGGTAVGAAALGAQTGVPTFTLSAAPSSVTVNTAYSYQFAATGTPTFTATGTLPTGLTLSTAGLLSGTPIALGTYTFSVVATNAGGATPTSVTILVYELASRQISPALQTISTSVGTAISSSLLSSNYGASVYSISPALPTPLVISASSGQITGIPATTLTKTRFTITGSNGVNTAVSYVDLTVDAAPVAPPSGGGGGGFIPAPALQLTPTIVWANPAAITTNDALSSLQLNAVAKNPSTGAVIGGTFKYFPAAGEKMPASSDATAGSTLLVNFTPSDTATYTATSGSTKIVVKQSTKDAAIVIASSSLSTSYDGNSHGVQYSSNAPTNSLSVTYGGFSNAPVNAGTYSVKVLSTDPQYVGSTTATLVIAKATPTVVWNTPATWNSTTAVTGSLLNASSTTMGTFTYSVAVGSNLAAGTQVIKAVFEPKDSTNFSSVTVEKSLVVSAGATTTTGLALVLKGKFTAATVLSAKDKAALKKAAPSKAVMVTVSSYVAKSASKTADLSASRAKAAKVVALLKKSAPNATYVIQAMGSTLNTACSAQKNECVLINIG